MKLTTRHIRRSILSIAAAIALIFSCKEPFKVIPPTKDTNLMVVEGFINPIGESKIRLSQSLRLSDKETTPGELKAQLQLEGENNTIYKFTEVGNGYYSLPAPNLASSQKYRLRIKRTNLKEYVSEYVPVLPTPPIDSLTWKRENEGVRIFASTHDAPSNSRYYKWEYDETWEINSVDVSRYIYPGLPGLRRDVKDYPLLYRCWGTGTTSSISIGSTINLAQNIVAENYIRFIPNGSQLLSVRYSILVKQYSLTPEAYMFYDLMGKNTELLGSVFDPQPTKTKGNITCITQPDENVIGFLSIATPTEKRLFINTNEVPGWKYDGCPPLYVDVNDADAIKLYFSMGLYLARDTVRTQAGLFWEAYLSPCLDCRLKGSNTKPSFW